MTNKNCPTCGNTKPCQCDQRDLDHFQSATQRLSLQEQKEILSYIRGEYQMNTLPLWLRDLIIDRDKAVMNVERLQERLANVSLAHHEFCMSLRQYISMKDIVEELQLLANTMSTHKALAEKIGISEQYLSDILKGKRNPSGKAVCKFLKIRPEIVFVEDK